VPQFTVNLIGSTRTRTSSCEWSGTAGTWDFRRDALIDLFNEAGQRVASYRCTGAGFRSTKRFPTSSEGHRRRHRDDHAGERGMGARSRGSGSRPRRRSKFRRS